MRLISGISLFLLSFPVSLCATLERSEKAKKQRARRLRQHAFALSALFLLGSVRSWPQEPRSEGPTVALGIELSLPDAAAFYIPVVGDGEMIGIVPLPKGRFAGIRITPRMRADSVQIDVSALTTAGKKLSEASCDEARSWNSEDAGSYEGKENATLLLSGLGRMGLPVLKVKVVRAVGPPPSPSGGFHNTYANFLAFCDCEYPAPRSISNLDGGSASGVAGIVSYPVAGKCVEISGCGQCCRIAIPAPVRKATP